MQQLALWKFVIKFWTYSKPFPLEAVIPKLGTWKNTRPNFLLKVVVARGLQLATLAGDEQVAERTRPWPLHQILCVQEVVIHLI